MPGAFFFFLRLLGAALLGLGGGTTAGFSQRFPPTRPAAPAAPSSPTAPASERPAGPVSLGIDVLAARQFDAVRGKRIGLLTHPAGVNRQGISSVDILRRAPGVQLTALFGVEHGIYGTIPATQRYPDHVDPRTGLTVYSLYNTVSSRKPTAAQLRGLHAVVIDLQDIGSRSYTFISAMKLVMEACFENGVEVIILDRPNPLGGLKADGPPLDAQWVSYVGAFRVPYVHGLTMGELARLAQDTPGVLDVSEAVRRRGRLTVVPMSGWRRSMRWPETGLRWIPTSPMIADFEACVGYAMIGLGTYFDPSAKFDLGFRHGIAQRHAFRVITHRTRKSDALARDLKTLRLPGLDFSEVSALDPQGKSVTGVQVIVNDWNRWNPTELSFHLMRLACHYNPANPFRQGDSSASGFLRHMGSTAFFDAIRQHGARLDVNAWIRTWQNQAQAHQQQSRKYWLYP